MRGYFGIGVEGVNKAMNVGALFRTAHAFGASFVFTVAATYREQMGQRADTSAATASVPFYAFPDIESFLLPKGCRLVGIELLDDAVELPRFRHPRQAAYVLGPERGSLAPAMVARCDAVVRIPTRFALNVGLAGALVMYDRLVTLGPYPARAVRPDETAARPHAYGEPKLRTKVERYRKTPPTAVHDG